MSIINVLPEEDVRKLRAVLEPYARSANLSALAASPENLALLQNIQADCASRIWQVLPDTVRDAVKKLGDPREKPYLLLKGLRLDEGNLATPSHIKPLVSKRQSLKADYFACGISRILGGALDMRDQLEIHDIVPQTVRSENEWEKERTYHRDDHGVFTLHCIKSNSGASTSIIDINSVCSHLSEETLKLLCEPLFYSHKNKNIAASILCYNDGFYSFNPKFQGVVAVAQGVDDAAKTALAKLKEALPKVQATTFVLEEGDCLLIDERRALHAASKFHSAEAPRWLVRSTVVPSNQQDRFSGLHIPVEWHESAAGLPRSQEDLEYLLGQMNKAQPKPTQLQK